MTLRGKGMFIWKIRRCEGGDPEAIARVAAAAGLTHVLVKIADGIYNYNVVNGRDLVPPLVQALRRRGIQVWGWHYVYGNDPVGEANRAIQRARQLQLDGYVINAEGHYKGKYEQARIFVQRIKGKMGMPIGLSSYRYPSYHPTFPWREFMPHMDYVMPQVYWLLAHNPGRQLRASLYELRKYNASAIYVPTGSMYPAYGWRPTASDIREFMQTAIDLGLPAANFYEWYQARTYLLDLWNVLADFAWPGAPSPAPPPPPPKDVVDRLLDGWNARDFNAILDLYHDNAVLVTASKVYTGKAALRRWYEGWLNSAVSGATFALLDKERNEQRYWFRWQARFPDGRKVRGEDTLNLRGQRIGYHYTYSSPV